MRCSPPSAPRCARLCSWVIMWAVALAVAVMAAAPGVAGAQCPEPTPSYTDSCGPTFVLPPWGDAGGWTDPSKYSTIQLADVNGDGSDELIARNDQGIEIYWFDTTTDGSGGPSDVGNGQWRPQADAKGLQWVLTDFRSPLPTESPATNWTKPQYYSTIQAADVDGQPGAEILARFADGMHVYKYTPPDTARSIDGGTWQSIGTGGPFSDAAGGNDPSVYSTIQVGKFRAPDLPLMFARLNVSGEAADGGDEPTVIFYRWDGASGTWAALPVNDWYIDVFGNDNGVRAAVVLPRPAERELRCREPDVDPADTAQVIGRPVRRGGDRDSVPGRLGSRSRRTTFSAMRRSPGDGPPIVRLPVLERRRVRGRERRLPGQQSVVLRDAAGRRHRRRRGGRAGRARERRAARRAATTASRWVSSAPCRR